jgi:hypothetical protein
VKRRVLALEREDNEFRGGNAMATKPKPDRCAFERKAVEKIEKRIADIDVILLHPEDLPLGGVERLEKERKELQDEKLPAARASLKKCQAAARDTPSKKKKTARAKKKVKGY